MFFKTITLKSPAKINLVLSVPNSRDDGMHNVATVMHTVSLCDKIKVRKHKKIIVKSKKSPAGKDNICYKAAEFFANFGGAHITIKKRIPLAAGLGGGSSNAAQVLCALNSLYGNPYSALELEKMAISLGSDVPFFIKGGTQKVFGIGDELDECVNPFGYFVLVKHGRKMSTGQMYKKLDENGLVDRKAQVDAFCNRLKDTGLLEAAQFIFNDFESVCDCENIKRELRDLGANAACLSGSGPTVFGLFFDKKKAINCARKLKHKYSEVYVCRSFFE